MTRDQLDAIRARVEAATPGPWGIDDEFVVFSSSTTFADGSGYEQHVRVCEIPRWMSSGAMRERDADLITNAPTDLRALLAEVERLTAEVEAKTTQNVALIGQSGRLQQEVERLTAELHRMKSRPVEAEFLRLDAMWQQLVRERDEAVHELRRLKGDHAEVNTAKLNDAFTEGTPKAGDAMRPLVAAAFQRGAAAMREAALNVIDCDETEWRCHGDLHAERILAIPIPKDTP